MNIMEMKKEDFKKVPFRDKNTDLSDFYSVVILPTEEMHDSGYMCMDFVAVNTKREPICRLSGCSDVLDIDGIGGYGIDREGLTTGLAAVKGWAVDCLPCGLLRIYTKDGYKLKVGNMAGSNYELYGVNDR